MKKTIGLLNILLLAVSLGLTVYYHLEGGLLLKGITASGFVALGLVNLVYALLAKTPDRKYPLWMAAGLAVCMTGDIVLNISFISGAAIFALGHIFYCVAFCCLLKPRKADLLPIAVGFAAALMIIKLVPTLDFGTPLMEWVCIGYALVISCMVGKTMANFLRQRNPVTTLLLIGSCLFFFSDLMLVLNCFGDAPKITDTLCLYTYFPGQCLLAHSVYHTVRQ